MADAEAVRQVWGPIERDLSVDYKPEFVDQYKPVILRSIPKIVEYEIDQLRDSGMTLGEMREALKDIANEVDIDLPFPGRRLRVRSDHRTGPSNEDHGGNGRSANRGGS